MAIPVSTSLKNLVFSAKSSQRSLEQIFELDRCQMFVFFQSPTTHMLSRKRSVGAEAKPLPRDFRWAKDKENLICLFSRPTLRINRPIDRLSSKRDCPGMLFTEGQ